MTKATRWIFAIMATAAVLITGAVLLVAHSDFAGIKQELVRQVQEATGRRMVLSGKLELDLGFELTMRMGRAALLNPDWAARRELVSVESLSVRVALFPLLVGRLRINSVDVSGLDLCVEIAADGRSNLDPPAASQPSTDRGRGDASSPAQPASTGGDTSIELLKARDARMRLVDRRTGQDFSLSFDRLELRDSPGQPAKLKLEGRLDQWPLSLQTEVDRTGPGGRVWRLAHLDLTLGASDLAGELSLAPGAKRPKISGSLTSRVLDLRRLAGSGAPPPTAGNPGSSAEADGGDKASPSARKRRAGRRVFSRTPLDWQWLRRQDLALKYRVGRLMWDGPEMRDLAVSVAGSGGELKVDRLGADLAGGRLGGSLGLSAQKSGGGLLSIDVGLSGANLNRLLPSDARTLEKGGEMAALLRLETGGASPADLLAAAKGVAVLQVRGGQIEPGLIGYLGGGILTELLNRLNPFAQKRRQTELACLLMRADLDRGEARASVLFMETDVIAVSGSGGLDLANEELDLVLDPKPKKGIGVKGLAEVDVSLSGLMQPFKLGGTLADPHMVLDAAGLLETVGRTVAWYGLLGPGGLIGGFVDGSLGARAGCPQAEEAAWKDLKRP